MDVTRLRWIVAFVGVLLVATDAAAQNEIVLENQLPGNPASQWDISGAGDPSIQGFATDVSVNQGETITFKIDTDATDYRVEIYRLGYYGGMGARLVETVDPSVTLPQTQPACISDPATGLLDCGNWDASASWLVPAMVSSAPACRLRYADTRLVVPGCGSTSDRRYATWPVRSTRSTTRSGLWNVTGASRSRITVGSSQNVHGVTRGTLVNPKTTTSSSHASRR